MVPMTQEQFDALPPMLKVTQDRFHQLMAAYPRVPAVLPTGVIGDFPGIQLVVAEPVPWWRRLSRWLVRKLA
jgi:hypothetical protein